MSAFEKFVILVAGGTGQRMGANVPKQFLKINGRAVVLHSIDRFVDALEDNFQLVIVSHPDHLQTMKSMVDTSFPSLQYMLVAGGKNRFDSCFNGIKAIDQFDDSAIVAIHDAVRPNVSKLVIHSAFATAKANGSGIPAIPVVDSMRSLESSGKSKIVDRSGLRLIQTPQCFSLLKLKQAYESAAVSESSSFTDDASVFEHNGNELRFSEGSSENVKLTTPEQLDLFAYLLRDKTN